MDKVPSQHLHFLFDEPIYVLDGHGDHPLKEKSEDEIKDKSKEQVTAPPTESSVAETVDNGAVKNFRGNNAKGIVIILNEADTNDADESFLFKGLNALNITIEDVAILYSEDDLDEGIPHSKRLIFDINAEQGAKYQVREAGNLRNLHCDPLSEIQTNQELKVKFWLALKELFN